MAPYVVVPASASSMVPLPGLVGEPQSGEIKKQIKEDRVKEAKIKSRYNQGLYWIQNMI